MKPKIIHPLTEKINAKQKYEAKTARKAALEWLKHHFPEVFDTTNQIRPLKCGIMQDILQYIDENNINIISKSKLRQAVVQFTRSLEYLTCLKAQEMRVDLYGNATVPVTEEDSQNAAQKINKLIEKQMQFAATQAKSEVTPTSTLKPYAMSYLTKDGSCARSEVEKTPEIIIRPKKRTLDPEAITRMKETLGLK